MNRFVILNDNEKNVNENPSHAAFQKLIGDFELSYINNSKLYIYNLFLRHSPTYNE